ncbi:hypothetical protein OAD75_06075 [Gammaproteobacteria bacterium]|nr:hypothetical protein [Gammaproteobacteria bacterium]
MTDTNKILIGVGVLGALGTGIYLLTRSNTITTTTTTNPNLGDPSLATIDSLGTTIGNLFTELFAKNSNDKSGVVCDAPADPYTADGIVASNYTSSQVKTMQTNLSNFNSDIKSIIDGSGGVDGIIGPGFKTAYNMARKTCLISSISNLL